MKAIIFAGIGLFAAATIYGITDFAADKKKGTLDKLYKEEAAAPVTESKETAAALAVPAEITAAPAGNENSAVPAVKKTAVRKKAKKALPGEEPRFIKLENFSRGRIAPREIKAETPAETDKELKKEEQ